MPLLTLHLFQGPSQHDHKPLTTPQTIFVDDHIATLKPLSAVIREQVVRSNRNLPHYFDHDIISAETGAGNDVKQIMHLPIAIFFESIKFDLQKALYVVIPPLHLSPSIGNDVAWMRHPTLQSPQHSCHYTRSHSGRPPTTALPPSTPYNVVTPSFPTPQNMYPTSHQLEGNNHGGNYSSSCIQMFPQPPALSLPNDPTRQGRSSGMKRPSSSLYEYNPLSDAPIKRPFPPRPPQLPQRYHNTTTTPTVVNRTKACSKCNKTLPWELFSKRQWTNRDELRQCKSCVEETLDQSPAKSPAASSIIPQEIISRDAADTAKDAGNEPNSMPTPKDVNERTKPCSKCNKTLPWEQFSKRQWTSRDDIRQCKNCLENVTVLKEDKDKKTICLEISSEERGNVCRKNPTETFSESSDPANHYDNHAEGDQTKPCAKCKTSFPRGSFSKRQWTNHDEIRQCRNCLAQSSASTDQENISLKTCNICKNSLPASSFSKRQWKTRVDARLCMECIDGNSGKKEVNQ